MPLSLRVLLLLLLSFCGRVSAAEAPAAPPDPAKLTADAMRAYQAGDWATAIEKFEAVAAADTISAELCHNLSNAHFRAGNEAKAALWARRALAMKFWLPETRQNFRFLGNKLGFLSFDRRPAERLRRQWLHTALFAASWTAGLSIIWLAWATPRQGRRWPLITLLALALPVTIACIVAFVSKNGAPAPVAATSVVMTADAAAFTAPAEASPTVISLPPGSEVRPLRTEGLWSYCTIPGDDDQPLRGWVRTAALEPLWPWQPSLVD